MHFLVDTMHCTEDRPMPADRDQMGRVWVHHGAEPQLDLGSNVYQCVFCGQVFREVFE